jgi:hypothetical protein
VPYFLRNKQWKERGIKAVQRRKVWWIRESSLEEVSLKLGPEKGAAYLGTGIENYSRET